MSAPDTMNKYVVTATRTPTSYNSPTSYVVEAASSDDATDVVRHSLRDFTWNYVYQVKPYIPPPPGRILSSY
jgi:hypothetical protein